jgi:two-component system NtrC family sensor kinase
MTNAQVLVVADTLDVANYLIDNLLPSAGYTAIKAEDLVSPPSCDVVLVDISLMRSASPFASLKAQRRMGCDAPAILFVPRLTEQMATEVFPLGIQELVLKPIEDSTRLEKLAEFVTHAIDNQSQAAVRAHLDQIQAALTRRLNEMKTLSQIIRAIGSLTELDAIMAHIVEAGVYLTRAEEGAVFLLDRESGQLLMYAQQGMGAKRAEAIHQPSTDSDAMIVLQTGQAVVRGGEEEHKVKTGYLTRALINVPIILDAEVTGVLAVYNSQSFHSFEDSDQVVLGNLADYAAIALDKAQILATQNVHVEAAVEKAHRVALHARTLYDPIDGIESQVDTLLVGGFGSLTETQHSAVARIKQATVRLKEIIGFIREETEETV